MQNLVLEASQNLLCIPQGGNFPLGPDPVEVFRQYHKIMAKTEEKRQSVHWGAVAAILDDFLTAGHFRRGGEGRHDPSDLLPDGLIQKIFLNKIIDKTAVSVKVQVVSGNGDLPGCRGRQMA